AEKLLGIHVNLLAVRRERDAPQARPEEEAYLGQLAQWLREGTGYQAIQGTRPQTLAYALTDSPAGLAAWIVDKFRAWSDCGGDVESAIDPTACSRISVSIGSPARSARHFFRITRACTGRGRCRDRSPRRPATPNSRPRSCARREASPSAPTAISGAGPSCQKAGISLQ